MTTTIIILSLVIIVLGYIVYNLLRKNEKCEDIIIFDQKYMKNISEIITFSSEKLKEIDRKGSFESDDEVGFFFKNLKFIQEQIDEFNLLKK